LGGLFVVLGGPKVIFMGGLFLIFGRAECHVFGRAKFYFHWEGPFELIGGPFLLLGGPFAGGLKIIKRRAVLFCWKSP